MQADMKNTNFWLKLVKPILALAPMEDVTDTVYRQIIAQAGKPDVFFTEFTSVEGICSKGRDHIIKRLQFSEKERPIVAQIWGLKPENFYQSAKLIHELGFDGIDLNMGCPEKSVIKRGSCGALIKNPALAKEIIQATKEGAGGLPVSVKTRIGFEEIQTEEWVEFLLSQNIQALTLHLRTVKEESEVPTHWEEITKAVRIRNDKKLSTLILGNGDIKSREEALEKVNLYGIDGVMIGRGIFHNLWLFNKEINISDITPQMKLTMLLEHAKLFQKTWGKTKNFSVLKRFFKAYVSGFTHAAELRVKLMETKNIEEVISFLETVLKNQV